jgi:hypothetical protein
MGHGEDVLTTVTRVGTLFFFSVSGLKLHVLDGISIFRGDWEGSFLGGVVHSM